MYVTGRTFPVEEHYLEDVHKFIKKGQRLANENTVVSTKKASFQKVDRRSLEIARPKFDADLIAELIIRIIQQFSGLSSQSLVNQTKEERKGEAILVFLSGIQAIEKVNKALGQRKAPSLAVITILHGSLPPEEQRKVFKTAKEGKWKVVSQKNNYFMLNTVWN